MQLLLWFQLNHSIVMTKIFIEFFDTQSNDLKVL